MGHDSGFLDVAQVSSATETPQQDTVLRANPSEPRADVCAMLSGLKDPPPSTGVRLRSCGDSACCLVLQNPNCNGSTPPTLPSHRFSGSGTRA